MNDNNRNTCLEKSQEIQRFKLVLVGQDPYLAGANGIAFCKNTFEELFDTYCCGKEVLYSLGLSKEQMIENYESPLHLFMDLLSNGIAFVNVSSVLLEQADELSIEKDKAYNESFLSKADNIVLLGKGKTTNYFRKYYSKYNDTTSLIHPSGLAKPSNLKEWNEVWETEYLRGNFLTSDIKLKNKSMEIENYFNLDIPSFQLYSKGNAVEGVHGIELINGEYFASHFHLKTKIAKGSLKQFLEETTPKELYSLALKENSDFKNWPEVKYDGDDYSIKKYQFTWLMDHFKKSNG